MSEAEKKLSEERIFTKQTVSGKCVYQDRYIEWIVKDIRSVTGKKFGEGQSLKILGVVHRLITSFCCS